MYGTLVALFLVMSSITPRSSQYSESSSERTSSSRLSNESSQISKTTSKRSSTSSSSVGIEILRENETIIPKKINKPTTTKTSDFVLSKRERTQEKVKEVFFKILEIVTLDISPSRSRIYGGRSHHALRNRKETKKEKMFGCEVLGNARNIVQEDFLRNKDDYKAAKDLLNVLKKDENPQFKVRPVKFNQTKANHGICAGIGIDIAVRHLINEEPLDAIIASGEKGASAEAAANQAIYTLLKDVNGIGYKGFSEILLTHFMDVGDLTHDTLPDFTSLAFREMIKNAQENTQKNHPLNFQLSDMKDLRAYDTLFHLTQPHLPPKVNKDPTALDRAFTKVLAEAKEQLDSKGKHPWLSKNSKIYVIRDLEKFKQSILKNGDVNEKVLDAILAGYPYSIVGDNYKVKKQSFLRSQSNDDSLWTKFTLKAGKVFGVISPTKTIQIKKHKSDYNYLVERADRFNDIERIAYVAKARGIKIGPRMGFSTAYRDDSSYLKLLELAPAGLYAMNFQVGGGGHFITVQKNEDGTYVIMDPNVPQVKAENFVMARNFMLNLLEGYPPPNLKRPWDREYKDPKVISKDETKSKTKILGAKKRVTHHEIALYKMEAL